MNLKEYATYDGLGLAALVKEKHVSAKELADLAFTASEKMKPLLGGVVELYDDKRAAQGLSKGAFHGVPTMMKDVFGHEAGRKIEFGSRLCEGMVAEVDSALFTNLKAAGLNIMGRTAAPEFSMSGTTENALYGKTSTPFKQGYSAGGSSGGSASVVAAGIVPLAHGSDIGGSIRIPASYCGGYGFKPSRLRVSVAPTVDEGGWGYSANHVQTRTVRDSAAVLDCIAKPHLGDPFVIPKPSLSYAKLIEKPLKKLKIGVVLDQYFDVTIDEEVKAATLKTAKLLADMGHTVEEVKTDLGMSGEAAGAHIHDIFFYGYDLRLDGLAAKLGRKISSETLEHVTLLFYHEAKKMHPSRFFAAFAAMNKVRRSLSQFWGKYDIMLSPTTATTSFKWDLYNLAQTLVTAENFYRTGFYVPIQHTIIHNIMGTPAASLPLFMHSNGLPIGTQIAASPANDHLVLALSKRLEEAQSWHSRIPSLHVSRL